MYNSAASLVSVTNTIQSLQFGWFVGHLFTLFGVLFYTLTYLRIGTLFYKFWYILSLVGIIGSFGILLFQITSKTGGKTAFLVRNENTHYLLISTVFLLLRPYVLLPLFPFAFFAFFHVLAYTNAKLLPIVGLGSNSPISRSITSVTSKYNITSIQLGSSLEILSLVWLLVRVITFRSNSLFPFLAYVVFVKLRFEHSEYTRNYIKSIELRVDDVVNQAQVPALKQAWLSVKGVFRKIGGVYLVNNYTKTKAT